MSPEVASATDSHLMPETLVKVLNHDGMTNIEIRPEVHGKAANLMLTFARRRLETRMECMLCA